jgi:hypothetical protein
MCAQSGSRDTFDRLASEYDELKLRVIPGYRQVQDLALRDADRTPRGAFSSSAAAPANGHQPSCDPEADDAVIEFSPNMRELALRQRPSPMRVSQTRLTTPSPMRVSHTRLTTPSPLRSVAREP